MGTNTSPSRLLITINNGAYTKEIIFTVNTSFEFTLAIKSLKWLVLWYKGMFNPKLMEHSKKVTSYKKRGSFIQKVRKHFRFPLFDIEWTITRKYDKRKVYVYYYHKRYLNQRPGFFTQLRNELKRLRSKKG